MDFLLNFSFLAFLLLFAGIALGHMIWGRGRSEDEERLGVLQDKNESLQSELEEQRRVSAQMESALQSQQKEAERFQESSAQLEQLKVQHGDLQNALAAAEHNASKVQTLSEKLQSHVSEFHRERDQFVDAVQIRLEDQSRQIERLSDERDAAVDELGSVKSERSSLQSTCDHQARELDELREKYAKSSGQASEVAGEVVDLRQRLEVANSELSKEQHQREHLQSVLDGRKLEYETLMQDIEQLEGSFQKMCLQNEKLTEESSLLATLRIEHQETKAQLDRKHNELLASKEEQAELEQELVRAAQRSQDIEDGKVTAEAEIETLFRERDELAEQCDQQSKQLVVASKIAESKTKLETENQALIRAKQSVEDHVAKLEAECEQSEQTVGELQTALDEFKSHQESLEGQIETAERGRSELETELHELKGKYGESVKAHAYAVDECDELITAAERSDQRALKLEQEIERLESIIEAREVDIADIQQKLDDRDADLQELRATDEQAYQKYEDAQQRVEDLVQQVASLTGVKSELVDDAKTLQSKYDSKCEEIVALAASRDEVTESYRDAQEELLDVQRRLVESEEQRSKLDAMVVEYRGKVDATSEEVETLSTERDDLSSRLGFKLVEIETLTAKLQGLETSKGASDSAFGDLQERYDQVQSELSDTQKSRNEISESHQELQEEIVELKRAADETEQSRETIEGELTALQEQYAERATKLAEATAESEQALAAHKESEATVLVLREQIRQLEEIHGANDVDVADLRARYEEKERELNDAVEAREELVATNKQAEDKITRLEVKVQQLEKVRSEANEELTSLREKLSEVGDLKRNLVDQNRRLEVLVAEREGYTKSRSAVDLRIQQLESEIERQNKSFTTINQQHEQLRAKLKLENERYELAAAELETQRERVTALESELEEFEALKQEHVELQSQLTDIKDRLRKLASERDTSVKEKRDLERQVVSLRHHNVANEDTIRDLRRERLAVIERLRNRAVAAQGGETGLKLVRYHDEGQEEVAEPNTVEPAMPSNMVRDDRLGMVYTEAPDEVDDLKEIYGIAGVLEGKLNDFGVYTYQQIMDWDEATVEEFSARLAFKDRIERDGWILQATRLHEAKYNPSKKAA
ncbi:MAG: hypothetical protein AAGG44_06630 [Planctomycetota bacterium]